MLGEGIFIAGFSRIFHIDGHLQKSIFEKNFFKFVKAIHRTGTVRVWRVYPELGHESLWLDDGRMWSVVNLVNFFGDSMFFEWPSSIIVFYFPNLNENSSELLKAFKISINLNRNRWIMKNFWQKTLTKTSNWPHNQTIGSLSARIFQNSKMATSTYTSTVETTTHNKSVQIKTAQQNRTLTGSLWIFRKELSQFIWNTFLFLNLWVIWWQH